MPRRLKLDELHVVAQLFAQIQIGEVRESWHMPDETPVAARSRYDLAHLREALDLDPDVMKRRRAGRSYRTTGCWYCKMRC